jgi:hypothetical protein
MPKDVRDINLSELDAVSGGVSVNALGLMLPHTQSQLQVQSGYDTHYGTPTAVASMPPNYAALLGVPQGAPSAGYLPPGYAPQGYAPQGYAPQGYAPQGYAPQGYAPQGYAPQGYAPQGYGLPQGYVAVPQSYVTQLQNLAAHPTYTPAPVAAPQPNPLAQIQQGLGIANQLGSLFRGFGGGGGAGAGAGAQGQGPQGFGDQFPQGGQESYGPDPGGYGGDYGGSFD